VERAASAVAKTERVQFTSKSVDGWPEKTCGRLPNLRHRLRGNGKSLGSVAGQLGAQSAMQDGSFVKPREDRPALSETFLPWSRRQLSEAGKEPVGDESREAYASTFAAGRREVALDAKTGRANERARGRGRETRVELVATNEEQPQHEMERRTE
jgi:hypothetical protein